MPKQTPETQSSPTTETGRLQGNGGHAGPERESTRPARPNGSAPVEQRPQQRIRRGRSWLRRIFVVLLVLVLLAGLGYLLGPRPSLDPANVPEPDGLPESLNELAQLISDRESEVEGLTFGTQARVLWGDITGHGERSELALVYLHGFTASRQEITPVVETAARRLNANAYFARFKGHGKDGAALKKATAQQWLAEALEALRIGQRLGERVVLVGTSTGASLASWLAATYPEDVAGLVLISPNFAPRDERTQWLTGPWGERIGRWMTDGVVEFEARNEAHARYWTRQVPVEAVVQMMLLVEAARDAALEKVKAPVWLLYHPEDPVVQPEAMLEALQRMPNEKNRVTDISETHEPEYAHILTGRHLAKSTTNWVEHQLTAFLREAVLVAENETSQPRKPEASDVDPVEAEDHEDE